MPYLDIDETGMRLRKVESQDREHLAGWIAADPDHADTTPVDFFAEEAPGLECYVVEDEGGTLFYLKLTRAARIDIQFPPEDDAHTRSRTRQGLISGFLWLAALLEARSFREVIFNSKNEMLMRAMEKRLCFVRSPGEMVRTLFPRKES